MLKSNVAEVTDDFPVLSQNYKGWYTIQTKTFQIKDENNNGEGKKLINLSLDMFCDEKVFELSLESFVKFRFPSGRTTKKLTIKELFWLIDVVVNNPQIFHRGQRHSCVNEIGQDVPSPKSAVEGWYTLYCDIDEVNEDKENVVSVYFSTSENDLRKLNNDSLVKFKFETGRTTNSFTLMELHFLEEAVNSASDIFRHCN